MATIITVHGTFASGPEEGNDWWQRSSEFERDIRNFVEAADGQLKLEPHVWDGRNSEASRRAAGEALLHKLEAIEAKGEHYSLVGHSHGGSVVCSCFEQARKALVGRKLSSWVTVGTPFIVVRRRRLSSRLPLLYRTVLFAALWFTLGAVIHAVTTGASWATNPYIDQRQRGLLWPKMAIDLIGVTLLPLVVVYVTLSFLTFRWQTLPRRIREFDIKRISLFHGSDEAINGLAALNNAQIPIFNARQITAILLAPVSTFAGFFILILLLLIHTNFSVDILLSNNLPAFITSLWDTTFGLHDILPSYYWSLEVYLGNQLVIIDVREIVTRGFVAPLFVFTMAILFVMGAQFVFKWLSIFLARMLDAAVWNQLRQTGFGNDNLEVAPSGLQTHPSWSTKRNLPLPDEVADAITRLANESASLSVARFRNAIGQLAFKTGGNGGRDPFENYLTWDELIHTSYFKVPRFRMLVAYAIAHSPGFRPSAAFKSHPDYELVAGWYQEIQPREEGAQA